MEGVFSFLHLELTEDMFRCAAPRHLREDRLRPESMKNYRCLRSRCALSTCLLVTSCTDNRGDGKRRSTKALLQHVLRFKSIMTRAELNCKQ